MAELKPGDQAPDFEATNDQNEKVRLGDLRGQRLRKSPTTRRCMVSFSRPGNTNRGRERMNESTWQSKVRYKTS